MQLIIGRQVQPTTIPMRETNTLYAMPVQLMDAQVTVEVIVAQCMEDALLALKAVEG